MKASEYKTIENYMLDCMSDSAHDPEHVMRVLYIALRLAAAEQGIDYDILIASCLLHDIGRKAEFRDPKVSHADEGGRMAEAFLTGIGWDAQRARHVSDCVRTHRFRSGDAPQSLEAKILFDSDKLDVTGALGIARTLLYKGYVGQPIYTVSGGEICAGTDKDCPASFYKEYNFKLKNLESKLYTQEAKSIAHHRGVISAAFFDELKEEADSAHASKGMLYSCLEE
jgi:uncharacterized protein